MLNNYLFKDVLPEEKPILFSNKQLYRNDAFSKKSIKNDIVNSTNLKNLKIDKYKERNMYNTIPMLMNVKVNDHKSREISILHPFAQIVTFRFIVQFENQLINQFKKSNFSIRSPRKQNQKASSLIPGNIDAYMDYSYIKHLISIPHYFSYKGVSSFNDLFKNSNFIIAQSEFRKLMKFDILNFFPSIYTHSIAWALFSSKKLGKIYQGSRDVFPNQADKITQSINFNETNGVVVGPEYSRIIAELVLSHIDNKVESILESKHLKLCKDYNVFRYVDDTFVFYNDDKVKNTILEIYEEYFQKFNLKINNHKTIYYESPMEVQNSSILDVRSAFYHFKMSNFEYVSRENINKISNMISSNLTIYNPLNIEETRGTYGNWTNLFSKIKQIIIKDKENKTKIINYFFASIMNKVNLYPKFQWYSESYFNVLKLFLNETILLLKESPTRKTYKYFINIQLTLVQSVMKSFFDNSINEDIRDYIFKIIFKSLFGVISFNWFDPLQGYELYPFMKFFKKYGLNVNTHTLINHIKKYNDYFILTAIAYYILDDNGVDVSGNMITVKKVLFKHIYSLINNFNNKGLKEDNLWHDGEYFYIINDFSKYPAFDKREKNIILSFMKFNDDNSIIKDITKESYYQWKANFDEYISLTEIDKLMKNIY